TIVGGRPMAEELGRRVRRSRPEWRGFLLRRLGGLAEHLGRAGLIEARLETALANAFENAEGPQARRVAGVFRNLEADFDVALRAQIVDLVRTDGPQQPVHRRGVTEIAVVKILRTGGPGGGACVLEQMVDAGPIQRAGAAHEPVDFVSLLEEKLRQVRAVLPGDPGDERLPGGHQPSPPAPAAGLLPGRVSSRRVRKPSSPV